MEELAMQSSMVELGIWEVFVQSRVSISIIFLGNVISILIAVWISRVLIEKGANLFLKIIFTAFAFAVFLNAFNNGLWVNFYMDGTAASLANLDAVNGAIDISACLFFLSADYYLQLFHCGLIQIQKKYEFSTVRWE